MHQRIAPFSLLFIIVSSLAHAKTTIVKPFEGGPFKPLPTSAPIPKNNPMTPAKISLGKQLYFDPRLSKDGTVSCNSCHNVMSSGTDNRAVSVGISGKTGGRSSPTVWNSAFMSVQFWDGRAKDLEEQAKGPLTNPVEMGADNHDFVMTRIKKIPGYVSQFKAVFGGKDSLTIDNLAKAIAAYERTLITPNSPFDRYLNGDTKAISEQAIRGAKLVVEIGCTTCHFDNNLAGPPAPEEYGHFQPFPRYPGSEYESKYHLKEDKGRFDVSKDENEKHTFRVQTWRNIALTAPYFHNGSVKTLPEAVRVMAKTQLDLTLQENQVNDIVAFLNTLTGEFPKQTLPRLPDSPNETLVD